MFLVGVLARRLVGGVRGFEVFFVAGAGVGQASGISRDCVLDRGEVADEIRDLGQEHQRRDRGRPLTASDPHGCQMQHGAAMRVNRLGLGARLLLDSLAPAGVAQQPFAANGGPMGVFARHKVDVDPGFSLRAGTRTCGWSRRLVFWKPVLSAISFRYLLATDRATG